MAASKLLTNPLYAYGDILNGSRNYLNRVNITFDDKVEEMRYDPKDVPDELGINEDWEPQNQVTIN